jgi:hypothetical protein
MWSDYVSRDDSDSFTRTKGNTMATTTKAKKSSKSAASDDVTLSSVYATVASRKSIDTTRAAKLVRSRLRSNFAKVCELSPNVTKAKQSANDGNRWPTHVTRDLAEFILGGGSPE